MILFHSVAQEMKPIVSHPPLIHTVIQTLFVVHLPKGLHKLHLCPFLREDEGLWALQAKKKNNNKKQSCSVLQSGIPLGCECECKSQQKEGR